VIVLPNEPLARHLPLRTGGACGAFVWVDDDEELATVLRDCRRADWKVRVLGAGTRVIARDGAHAGAVVRLAGSHERLEPVDDGFWEVGAGVLLPVLVTEAVRRGRTGLERFGTSPGTLGASLLHDEGWDDVVDAIYVLSRDVRKTITKAELKEQSIVLGARLRLGADDPERIAARVAESWRRREPWAPGARYRHTPARRRGEPKAKGEVRDILSSVRLPMVRLREVAVPALAPELLCNLGAGTAADLQLLHRSAIERVEKVRGIELESLVEWIGSNG
jgi:UDP-N-acetylenolpyruvoylglucosamine reductase